MIALTPTPGIGNSIIVAVWGGNRNRIGPEHSPTGTMSGFVLLLKKGPRNTAFGTVAVNDTHLPLVLLLIFNDFGGETRSTWGLTRVLF